MAALMRYSLFGQRRLGQSLFNISVTKYYGTATPVTQRFAASTVKKHEQLMEEVHSRLDYNKGISTELLKELYSSLDNCDSLTEHDIGLLLHICNTGPFDSSPQKRLELLEDIWSKLGCSNITPSTKLYNIRLKAYCANHKQFSPVDELRQMKALGLNPDKITYTILIEGLCQKGDIAGANKVLETMKVSDYFLGIGIFNSFITGHLKAGSRNEADDVLDILRSRGLNPNSDTYFRFALHAAEEGDLDSVMKYVKEAEGGNVPMEHSKLFDLYKAMLASGHSDKTSPLLQMLTEKNNQATLWEKSCQLISEGFNEAALQLYLLMPQAFEKNLLNTGSFLLKSMIINGQNAKAVMEVADKIVENTPKAQAHRNALLYAYKSNRPDLAMELLELMQAKNHNIKVAYTVPAICSYRASNNNEGVYKAIDLLLALKGVQFRDDQIDQLLRCCYPVLMHLLHSREAIVDKFKEHEQIWNFIFFLKDLQEEGYAAAIKNAAGKELDGTLFSWRDFHYIINTLEMESCVEFLHFLSKQSGIQHEAVLSLAGNIVRNLLRGEDWNTLNSVTTAMQEMKLKLKVGFKQIPALEKAPEEIKQKMEQLCSIKPQYRTEAPSPKLAVLIDMTKEELEKYQKENPAQILASIALLNKALKAGNLEEIKQRLGQLQTVNFNLSMQQLVMVIIRLADLGDAESALQYLENLKELTGDNIKSTIPLCIAQTQVKAGNIDGAVKLIKVASESKFPKDEKVKYFYLEHLRKIIDNAPSLNDAKVLHSAIFTCGSLVHDQEALTLHAAYMARVIADCDDDELVYEAMKLHEKFKVFPLMDRILIRFIENQDIDRLKRVMDLGISVFGSNTFHNRLAICFLQCGMPSRAATILQTSGLRINEYVLTSGCRYFLKIKRVDLIESLMGITKDLPVSRAMLLKHLVQGYVANDDLKKAVDALQQFDESFVEPHDETIELLVRAHQSRNKEIPEVLKAYASNVEKVEKKSSTASSEVSNVAGESSSDLESPVVQPESKSDVPLEKSQ